MALAAGSTWRKGSFLFGLLLIPPAVTCSSLSQLYSFPKGCGDLGLRTTMCPVAGLWSGTFAYLIKRLLCGWRDCELLTNGRRLQ